MGLEVEAGKVGETVLRRRPKLRGKIPEWYGAGQRGREKACYKVGTKVEAVFEAAYARGAK
jgi:hypothetical protein